MSQSSLLRRRAERAGRPLAARTRPRRRSPSGQLGSPARIAIQANGIALDGIDPEANVIHWADIASKRLLASIDFDGIDPEAMGIHWTEIASKRWHARVAAGVGDEHVVAAVAAPV